MPVAHQLLVETLHLVQRQPQDRALGGTQTATPALALTTSASVSASASAASPSSTMSTQNTTGGTSSPLLFFVALGFGVVFTNLW